MIHRALVLICQAILSIFLATLLCLLTVGGMLSDMSLVYFVSSVAETVTSLSLMIQKVQLKQSESCK